ncbi:hypothetical protein ACGGZK_06900 [Agromyces sp. MMS24-K17]|uniref:hypothetical protein n=1 Tax=Agromyces sp. MMS24-K17 TaxID=3372850 RepID=UPI00375498C3
MSLVPPASHDTIAPPDPPAVHAPPSRPGPPQASRTGLAWAVTAAILVSLLPLVAAVLAIGGVTVVTFQSIEAFGEASDEAFDYPDGVTASDAGGDGDAVVGEDGEPPLDLPWGAEVTGPYDTRIVPTFSVDPAWGIADPDGPSELGYANPATGCQIWYWYGLVEPSIDLAAGDRSASAEFASWFLGVPPQELALEDSTLVTVRGEERGTADATLARFSYPGGVTGAMLSRVVGGLGEVVFVYAECPDEASIDAALANDIPTYLSLRLMPER